MKRIALNTIIILCMLFSFNQQASTTWIPISVGDITVIIPYVPDSIVYEDAQGNLYVKLTASHGNKLLKFTKGLYWTSSDITQDEWDKLTLTISQYSISYGNFVGDSSQDLKIINNNVEIIVKNNSGSYVVSQPEDNPDDGTIGNIDADGNGIRDDVELAISQLAPANSLKSGYLQHTAFYTRAFLLASDSANKKRFLTEMMKGHACLSNSSNNEEAYAKVVAGHLDSKERFERYTHNNSFLNQESITVNNIGCVLKGTGVEPVSGCFEQEYSWQSIVPQHNGYVYKDNLIMGENVKLIISSENLSTSDGNFDFSYFLNGVLQNEKNLGKGDKVSWIIENYNFDNNGNLKLLNNNATNSISFKWSVTCESNQ